MKQKIFHGWWMVAGFMAIATVAWSFALYGPSVYLHTISQSHDWSIGLVSSALTLAFLVNASVLGFVGSAIATYGPQRIMALGAAVMASGFATMGLITQVWHVYACFALMGLGWSCLSTTAITSSLAPWFDRHQGRAVSTALLGASIGGMIGVPILLALISWLGFARAMLVVALVVLGTVWPVSFFVLRRRPQDLGLYPDGATAAESAGVKSAKKWTRTEALNTSALRTVTLAFGLALMVQIGFLTHQVSLLLPAIGASATALFVTLAAVLAFFGRILLARFADHLDVRVIACGVLLNAAISLSLGFLFSTQVWALVLAVLGFGLTAGSITTLPPLIVRREFGAASFGAVFGITAMLMQIMSAMGPAFFGVLYDLSGGYQLPLGLAAVLNFFAAAVIMRGRNTLTKESS
ncbi:MFS transporter [Zwartia sp.]|uniref:MFS transporter n=1 Tax=Zwartia sp. TaxID=2978004 RepID=UPI0027280639|nr:MFS transporter [Zwartia sp.]MDO9024032.1 MFS transporter [Zwartia sp.]